MANAVDTRTGMLDTLSKLDTYVKRKLDHTKMLDPFQSLGPMKNVLVDSDDNVASSFEPINL